ncbi:MAG: hypothetical protein MST05_05455, partial [Treponema sp.]|nr:hypothetical protein [Treponema sp.]
LRVFFLFSENLPDVKILCYALPRSTPLNQPTTQKLPPKTQTAEAGPLSPPLTVSAPLVGVRMGKVKRDKTKSVKQA